MIRNHSDSPGEVKDTKLVCTWVHTYEYISKGFILVDTSQTTIPGQEQSNGHTVLCATAVLDKGADGLKQHVANKVYEKCRAGDGRLEVANFPDYKPLVTALQSTQPEVTAPAYQVTVQRHDKLVILSSLAKKFLETEEFKLEASNLIDEHNSVFNKDGEYLAEPEPTRTLSTIYLYTLWSTIDSDVNDWTGTWWSPNT